MKIFEKLPAAVGRVRACFVPCWPGKLFEPGGLMIRSPRGRWHDNLVMRSWGAIVGRLLGNADRKYRINGMYVEFANVASPGDPASVPSFDRDPASGLAYYNALAVNPNRDFLRVPMTASTLDSSDEELYPDGNLLTFFAQTTGVIGTWGKSFGESSNSVVVGGALVAQVVAADPTQDLLLSRFYFPVGEQQPKLDTGQVGLEWELELQ